MIRPKGFPGLPAEWVLDQETRESLDGEVNLFFNIFRKQSVSPASTTKRALVIVHGQGEHGMRYQHVPYYLGQLYSWMLAIDLRGHGRSEGLRGYVHRFDDYADDLKVAIQRAREEVGELGEVDVLAHSMGGLTAIRYLAIYPDARINACMISSPLMGLNVKVPYWKDRAAMLLNQLWPSLQMANEIDLQYISHDQNVVDAYKNDRLVHNKATPRFYVDLLNVMEECAQGAFPVSKSAPLLFQVAVQDHVVSYDATKHFFDHLDHPAKTWIEYPNCYHEIFNELNKDQVFGDLIQWRNKF
jgi:alpha-beta hydrolase superfamily lysophospholipase